ncbi:MAG: sigma-70 family RNA polymerase sigma factor [Thermoguttaceae bacterium]|nr:sigma-70 family RNA polymerase sigma factor [Thermoguttaceae bacterium]
METSHNNLDKLDCSNLSGNLTLMHPHLDLYITVLQTTDSPAVRNTILSALEDSNRGLASTIAAEAARRGANYEDARQDAIKGMIQAANKADPSRGNEVLRGYISTSMTNEANAPLRRAENRKPPSSLDKPVGESKEGNVITHADLAADKNQKTPEEAALKNEEALRVRMLWEAINSVLTPEQAELFRVYMESERSCAETARRMNRPYHQVTYQIDRIRAILREKLDRFNDAW